MIELLNGDCLELMKQIPDKSIDAIITDPPYGTTACKWDSVIPFDLMWTELNRIIKPNGAIVLFGSEPFSSALRISNIKHYKYDWIWDKKIPSGMSYARHQPMRQHECVSIFCNGKTLYNAQLTLRDKPIKSGGMTKGETTNNSKLKPLNKNYNYKQPTSLIKFDKIRKGSIHPTQKPVALLEYLAKTYTNENETILDFTMGSGTTGVACINTSRKFIGIERDTHYFEVARKRIEEAQQAHISGLF